VKNVEVLLREHVEPLGRCGEVVRVRPGYARNYLFPRRLAVQANEENKRAMQRRRAVLDAEEAERTREVEARVAVLSGLVLRTLQKADESGRLYGSVSAGRIAELLSERGQTVDERDVRLEAPIKTTGRHAVIVHVKGDRFAELVVEVEPEPTAQP